jgi:hypothetical protein
MCGLVQAGFTVVGTPVSDKKFRLCQFHFVLSFYDFWETRVSIKSMDSVSVCWRPRCDPIPASRPLNPSSFFCLSGVSFCQALCFTYSPENTPHEPRFGKRWGQENFRTLPMQLLENLAINVRLTTLTNCGVLAKFAQSVCPSEVRMEEM